MYDIGNLMASTTQREAGELEQALGIISSIFGDPLSLLFLLVCVCVGI